jgi:hypothetical protein
VRELSRKGGAIDSALRKMADALISTSRVTVTTSGAGL